jgi:uncharacterized repeat protein (TIGR01451 family)
VLRVQVEQKGDFALIGNTLGYECTNPVMPVVGTVSCAGSSNNGDSAPDVFWRSDAPAAGQAQANTGVTVAQARSTSVLNLPMGATVTHAFLYWGARQSAAGADTTVTLERPGAGGFTQNITALQSFQVAANNAYQSVADITLLVAANGSGAYRVSGVNVANIVNSNDNNNFAGWWMVVLYQLGTDPVRNLAIFDGLDIVSNGNNQNVTIAGFLAPNPVTDAKLGVVTFEGDTSILGDQLFFNGGAALQDALNPMDNFFNGTRSTLGMATSVPGDLPQMPGTAGSLAGMDIDIVDIKAKLMPGQTSAPIQATSTGDTYYLAGWVTSIATQQPDFSTSLKSAVDLNGGPLTAGDVVEYTIVATNTGNDTSINTVMTDAIPAGVTYVPGSLQVSAGANMGPKTDVTGDDQGEYDMATATLTVRLGAGADATQGGTMAVGASTTVVFQVTIDPGTVGTIENQAVINAGGMLGSPPMDTPTDGNGNGGGAPPTPVVVDQCIDDMGCMAPAPYCNVTLNPNECVECLLDAHCPGNLPTCDLATNTCVCIPTGMETCDNTDNDCDGVVDNGFNVGVACSAGVGACEVTGAIVCDGNGGAQCSAVSGEPDPEICDGLDNDCDGVTDNGFPLGMPCTSGVGACAADGSVVCDGMGGTTCDAVPGMPQPEMCGDAIDSDCDGQVDNGCNDSDMDGISDPVEVQAGTDPNDADSDDDGVIDGQEPDVGVDSDGDGLINGLDPDSDDDGLYDGTELGQGCSHPATDAGAGHCTPDADMGATTTDPLDADTDDGGVNDGGEDSNLNGAPDAGETDPTSGNGDDDASITDSDGDGLPDDLEVFIGTNPNDADSDDDGVSDGSERNPADDSDGDGLINSLDPDSDNDGLYDGTEDGYDCGGPGTDASAGHCVPDGDMGATTTSPLDPDTDDGGVTDGSEDTDLDGVVDSGETDPTTGNGGDDPQTTDSDNDGLTDDVEVFIGTDPNDADSDDDGVVDGQEPNPTDDTDGDGLINSLDSDSDDDGLFDGTELGKDCSNPATDASSGTCIPDGDMGATTTSPLDPDTDNGGVIDGAEDSNLNGVIDAGETDPTEGHGTDDPTAPNNDSDGDGLSDNVETTLGTDPKDADSDDDGISDGQEPNLSEDTDGDGLINPLDPDSDNDGLYDGTEVGNDCEGPGTDGSAGHCIPDGDSGATTTSPLDPDTDDGGVSDGSEDVNKNGVVDPGETDPTEGHGADDAMNADSDGDGLSDNFEVAIGTDKNDADTDDDGLIDGQEPNPTDDTDGDGVINALDADSDDDGLFDGTELGKDCSNPDTDVSKGNCIEDADGGATKTSPLDPDTDDGGVKDGDEDVNHNGVVDAGETDPTKGHGADDKPCTQDSDCGAPASGRVCDTMKGACVEGCRGTGGNGCPEGDKCSSTDATIGVCEEPTSPFYGEGSGLLCAAQEHGSDRGGSGAAWLLGLLAVARVSRRRRA